MSLIPLGFWAASAGGAAGSFDLLETQVLASSAASVTFSGLDAYAADYKHLQIRLTARDDLADTGSILTLQFNSDTGSNYSRHFLRGFNGSVQSGAGVSQSSMWVARIAANSSTGSSFGGAVVDILDPFQTTKYTTVRSLSGITSADNSVELQSGLWMNTNAVTEIKLDPLGSNLVTASRFSIYGIRG